MININAHSGDKGWMSLQRHGDDGDWQLIASSLWSGTDPQETIFFSILFFLSFLLPFFPFFFFFLGVYVCLFETRSWVVQTTSNCYDTRITLHSRSSCFGCPRTLCRPWTHKNLPASAFHVLGLKEGVCYNTQLFYLKKVLSLCMNMCECGCA